MIQVEKGKHMYGLVKVGEKGQVVIPKEARETFDIKPGDSLIVVGDENKGIAMMKEDKIKEFALKLMDLFSDSGKK